MNKIAVLYWKPGSCGDFIQSVLLSDSQNYTGVVGDFQQTTNGRVLAKNSFCNLNQKNNKWYLNDWSKKDFQHVNQLLSNNRCLIIPTHRLDQVDKLKRHWNNCVTIGITYPETLNNLVLKNWCKKVAFEDHRINKIYNKPMHNYLKKNGVFGEFIFKEQLKYGSNIKKSVCYNFDINIPLEEIYAKDLSSIKSLVSDHKIVNFHFNNWISQQNILYQYNYNINKNLKKTLGYNSKAPYQDNIDISIDLFDNILIKHVNKHINIKFPIFSSLAEANDFFKTQITA